MSRAIAAKMAVVITALVVFSSGFAVPPARAAEGDLACDEACVTNGSWSLGPVGIDPAAAVGVGRVTSVQKDGIEAEFAGTKARIVREGYDSAVWETPYKGLDLGGLDPHAGLAAFALTIAIGQPVRVEGGTPPTSSGGVWSGVSHVRFNWWEGRQYVISDKGSGVQSTVAVGSVVSADASGVQIRIADGTSVRQLWGAAYPGTVYGRIVAEAGDRPYDGLAVQYDLRFAPTLLHPGDPLMIWLEPDPWANTNPRREGTTDPSVSCGQVTGREQCRWSAARIVVVPALVRDAKPTWWEQPAYSWSNVNPDAGFDDLLKACQFNSQASGRVVATDEASGIVTILSSEELVSMIRPAGAPWPLVGEKVRLDGGGCIENGQIQRPHDILIAPRSQSGGLVGSTPSSHVLALSVDRSSPMPVTEPRTADGMSWTGTVNRFDLEVTIDGAAQMPLDGTLQVLVSDDGWLEPSAPGAESVTAATVRRLARTESIAGWGMRILRRPPEGTAPKSLTLTVLLIEGDGSYVSASTTIALEGGAYPAPLGTGDATFLAAQTGVSDLPPDGLIVSRGGTSVEISLAPEAYADGANNWAVLGCGPQDTCAKGVLDYDLNDFVHVSVAGSDGPEIDVMAPVGVVGVTYLFHYPSVTDGERWRGLGISPADLVWSYVGLDKVCDGALVSKAGGQASIRGRIVASLVTCSLPDFEAHVITLQEDDPLHSGPGAYGVGYLASLDFGITIGLGGNPTSQQDPGGLPTVGPLALLDALRVVHFEPCDPAVDPSRVPVAYDAERYVVPPTDGTAGRCAKQLSPMGMAHVLHGIASDPLLPETIPGGSPGAVTWFLSKIGRSVDHKDVDAYVAAILGRP